MNAYYNKSGTCNSNNDIFKTFFYGEAKAVPAWKKPVDHLLATLSILLACLTGAVAKRIWRASSVAFCLIGIVGVIGAMESGVLALWLGVLLALPCLALEFWILRKH